MKKLIAIAMAAAAMVAGAGWKNAGFVQVTGPDGIRAVGDKLTAMTGNPIVGMALQGAATKSLFEDELGPMRKGAAIYLPQFVGDKGEFEYAVLYPVTAGPEKFRKGNPGCEEKDGIFHLKKKCKFTYYGFSPDAKWIACSDKAEQVKLALKCVKDAEKPLGNRLVRLRLSSRGLLALLDSIDACTEKAKAMAEGAKETSDAAKAKKLEKTSAKLEQVKQSMDKVKKLLADVEGVGAAVSFGDKGLDVAVSVKTRKGTKLAELGSVPLAKNALAFAGADALSVAAAAPKASFDNGNPVDMWKQLVDIFARNGIRTDFVRLEEKDGTLRVEVDPKAAYRYFSTEGTNLLEKVSVEALTKDLENFKGQEMNFDKFSDGQKGTLVLKGYQGQGKFDERFAATFPDFAGKPFCYESVGSAYEILVAVVSQMLEIDEVRNMDGVKDFADVVKALPAAPKAGLGIAAWREGDALRGVLRISAEEIKAFSTASSLVMARMAAAQMAGGDDDDCGDDDDDGDDEEKSDDDK